MNNYTPEKDLLTLPEEVFIYTGTIPGKEKITMGLIGTGQHLTITNNGDRRTINIHITPEGKNPTDRVNYILDIRHFTLLRLFKKIEPIFVQLARKHLLSTTINLGKLKKYGLYCMPQQFEPDLANEFFSIKSKKIRSRKTVRRPVLVNLLKEPADLLTDIATAYMLFGSTRKRPHFQGLLFRDGAGKTNRRYFFVSRKQYNAFTTAYLSCVYHALAELDFKYKEEFFAFLGEEVRNRLKISQPSG